MRSTDVDWSIFKGGSGLISIDFKGGEEEGNDGDWEFRTEGELRGKAESNGGEFDGGGGTWDNLTKSRDIVIRTGDGIICGEFKYFDVDWEGVWGNNCCDCCGCWYDFADNGVF